MPQRLQSLPKRQGSTASSAAPMIWRHPRRDGPEFLTVVPGIRPAEDAVHDQKRVATPRAAMAAGADILVIGRAITGAADPAAAAKKILDELRHG